MGLLDIKELGKKENHLYLFLVIWLLLGLTIFEVLKLINLQIALIFFIIIYTPFLSFTLFLWIASFKTKNIRELSRLKKTSLLLLSLLFMPVLLILMVGLFIVALFFYILMTSVFTLYGCFKAGRKRDEKLYLKEKAWFWRGLEFWGGLGISIGLLLLFFIFTVQGVLYTTGVGLELLISVAFIAVIIVIGLLTVLNFFSSITGRFNAWLGTFFVLVTLYTLYLVLKVFMQISSGTGETTTEYPLVALLVLDIFILLYSIGGIIATQSELLAKKFKIFSQDNIFFWLLFCKAAWEFSVAFPYALLSGIDPIRPILVIGPLLSLIASIAVLVLFIFLTFWAGVYGIITYGKEKKKMKSVKREIKVAKTTGERIDQEPEEKIEEEE